ncbi:MAG: tetratricopeptide repeat protein [Candidatus Wallbacteria bacterium]|nr:tetratricopeptide repeat protein [Candidatus Wallbacteria bacterium]
MVLESGLADIQELRQRGLYQEAIATAEEALRQASPSPDSASLLETLTDLHCRVENLEAARRFARKLADLQIQSHGSASPQAADAQRLLARVLADSRGSSAGGGDPEKAAAECFVALSSLQERLGPNDLETLLCQSELGDCEAAAGRPRKALELYRSVLGQILASAPGGRLARARVLVKQAQVQLANRDPVRADEALSEALPALAAELGPAHSETRHALFLRDTCLTRLNERPKAIELLRRALRQTESTATGGALSHEMDTLQAQILLLLAGHEEAEGRFREAVELRRQQAAAAERVSGPDHPDVGQALNALALALEQAGALVDVLRLLDRSQAILERALGPDHRDVQMVRLNQATFVANNGNPAERTLALEWMLAIQKKRLGAHHREVQALVGLLAGQLEKELGPGHARIRQLLTENRHPAAVPLLLQPVRELQKRRGDDSPEAIEALEKVRAQVVEWLGTDHELHQQLLEELAGLYRRRGDLQEAGRCYGALAAIAEDKYGDGSPEARRHAESAARMSQERGDTSSAVEQLEQLERDTAARYGRDHHRTKAIREKLEALRGSASSSGNLQQNVMMGFWVIVLLLASPFAIRNIASGIGSWWNETFHPAPKVAAQRKVEELTEAIQKMSPGDPAWPSAARDLASRHMEEEHYAEARALYRSLVDETARAQGPAHPDLVPLLAELSRACAGEKSWSLALEADLRSLEILEKDPSRERETKASRARLASSFDSYQNATCWGYPFTWLYEAPLAEGQEPDWASTVVPLPIARWQELARRCCEPAALRIADRVLPLGNGFAGQSPAPAWVQRDTLGLAVGSLREVAGCPDLKYEVYLFAADQVPTRTTAKASMECTLVEGYCQAALAALPPESPLSEARGAVIGQKLAWCREHRGRLDEALALYEQSAAIAAKLEARVPGGSAMSQQAKRVAARARRVAAVMEKLRPASARSGR